MTNSFDLNNLEPMDAEGLNAITDSLGMEAMPSLPSVLPEYENLPPDSTQYKDESIDYANLVPVDENGYTIPNTEINYDNLVPYDEEVQKTKDLGVWDEAKLKMDIGNITQYRADIAKQVWSGNMTLEQAQSHVKNRHTEILDKYGITEVPEFSFSKLKDDPLRTVLGETAQMLPFYGEGLKKGAAYSAITVPASVAMRGLQGQVAGAGVGAVGGSVVPGAGTAAGAGAGAGVGRVGGTVVGLIEGVNNGMLLGTFHTSIDVEGMNLYMDLKEKGIDDNTAKVAGISGGILSGALEVCSFGIVTAPIKGAAKKAAAKMLWEGMKKSPATQKMFKNAVTFVTKEYFKRMGAEVSTEMLQDVVSNTMTLLAAQADSVETAKPTGEDWKNIITKTGPQTAAAMALMGLVSTPFDVYNANVGSVKNSGGEVGTKAEIEQNIQDLSEGKAVSGGDLVLEGGIAFDTVAEGQNTLSELEAELELSNEHLESMQKEVNTLSSKKELTPDEQTKLSSLKDEIKYEQDYQSLIKEEIVNTSAKMSQKENDATTRAARKAELQDKIKRKEKLTVEEKQELADISIAEFEDSEKADIDNKSTKAREKEVTKEIRDLDNDIEKAQAKEDKAREKRTKLEEKQDRLQTQINDIEKENAEIEKALTSTEIAEDKAEMKATLSRNKETIRALKDNIKNLEAQRLSLNAEIENAIREGDTLADKRALLDEERAGLSEGVVDENGKIDMTVKEYKNQRLAALKRTMKKIASAVKTGVRLTRREIRDVQNTAISLIKNSDMLNADKSKFLVTVRDLNSQAKLQKALPDLIKKISELEEKANKIAALKYIGKLLKQAKPKKGGKTPTGKYTADVQKVLDDIREATELTTAQAHNKIEEIFDKAKDRELTDEEVAKVRMLYNFSGIMDKSARELIPLARMLKMLIEDGKIAAELKAEEKKAYKEKLLKDAKESIEGSAGEVVIDRKKPDTKKVFSQFMMTLGHTFDGWEGLMHTLSLHDKEHKLQKILDIFPAKMRKISGIMEHTKKVNQAYKDIFNLKTDKQLIKKCNEDSIVEDIGTYTNQDGETITLQMSRAEARKLYMEMQDPTLADSFREGNKYTFEGDVSKADKSTEQLVKEFLTPEDKKFCEWQLQFYQEYGKRTNVFYREKFGMDMPANEFYSPIKRRSKEIQEGYDWRDEALHRLSMKPSSYKARTEVKNPLAPQNDMLCLADHIAQNEHYMSMDSLVTDMDTIFKNSDIRDIITNKYGEGILKVVDSFINDIKRDGIETARAELKGLNKYRTYLQGGLLGLKAQIALKQMTAIGVFANDIPAKDFALGLADFFKDPVKAVETLTKSEFLKDRQNALSMEMRDLVRSNEYHLFAKMEGLRKYMFWFTQFGDKWSIMIGGWTTYQHTLKNTGSEKMAMEAFERAADKYQQSGHIDQLSAWQRSNNVLQKAYVMFTSDQMKQARAELHAIRDAIVSGTQEDILKAAKTVAIMHIILPNIVQYITNGMEWDSDDQLRATILGPFNVYPILGDLFSTLYWAAARVVGKKVDNFGAFDTALFKPLKGIEKAFKKIDPEEITGEDIIECLLVLTKEVMPISGINLKPIIDFGENAPKYYEKGEYGKLTKLFAGWSPYIIEKKGKDSASDEDEDYVEDEE